MIPNNTHFDTTRANVEYNEALALDLVVSEAKDPELIAPFKGNMDLDKLRRAIGEYGAENIPLCMLTITNNSSGGQPVSMENIRGTKAMLREYDIPLFIDACRFAENAYFIKLREEGYRDTSVREIAREMFSYADGATMSAKKDGLVNMGGFITLNDGELAEQITNKLILIEGFPTYGGMAGRDLEAIARGLQEVVDEEYLQYRIAQVESLGAMLDDEGVPYLKPTGGHALYLDAKKFLPAIPRSQFPGQSLTVELYTDAGIRAVEIGSLMFAHEAPESGEMVYPDLELVRLAIPRRVYTNMQMQYVAESILGIYRRREELPGYRIVKEAPVLRHFTARLEPIA